MMATTKGMNLGEIGIKIDYIEKKVDSIDQKLTDDFVTQKEFQPIRNLMYGLVATILLAFLGTLIWIIGWKK